MLNTGSRIRWDSLLTRGDFVEFKNLPISADKFLRKAFHFIY